MQQSSATACASGADPSVRDAKPWDRYTPRRRALFLFVLFLVGTSNYVDRNIIGILLEPIKAEFGASDTMLGLLSGLSFAVFYATLGLPVARWADRGDRRLIITVSLTVWSLMTALCGLAQNFWHLALARVGVGAGEAGAIPPAQSLTEWRQAPASAQRPVPGQKLAEGDMNSWAWTKPGATQPSDPAARWVLLHVSFTPRRAVATAGGTLRFANLAGRAEIWLDGTRIAVKDDPAPGPLRLSFPPGTGERQLDVLFDTLGTLSQTGNRFGIAGTVSLALTVSANGSRIRS